MSKIADTTVANTYFAVTSFTITSVTNTSVAETFVIISFVNEYFDAGTSVTLVIKTVGITIPITDISLAAAAAAGASDNFNNVEQFLW